MNRSLPMVLPWLAPLLMGTACSQPPSSGQVATVDSLIVANHAALLTLRELDHRRYQRLDSLNRTHGQAIRARLSDTLRPGEARVLATVYLGLREAALMVRDQVSLLQRAEQRDQRLYLLKEDLLADRLPLREAAAYIDLERRVQAYDHQQLLTAIANYRAAQGAWEQCDSVEYVLAQADKQP
jgi:uncharacterized membrane protein